MKGYACPGELPMNRVSRSVPRALRLSLSKPAEQPTSLRSP
ncbi:MAG: hypothetical protein ACKOPR_07310 [Chakrabartia godavariana]